MKEDIVRRMIKRKNLHMSSCVIAVVSAVAALYRAIMVIIFFTETDSPSVNTKSAPQHATEMSWVVIGLVVVFIAATVAAVITAGEKEKNGVKLLRIDNLFSDVEIALGALAVLPLMLGTIFMVAGIARDPAFLRMMNRFTSAPERADDFVRGLGDLGGFFWIPNQLEPRITTCLGIIMVLLAAIVELAVICSVARKVKNGVFLKNIAICVFIRYLLDSAARSASVLALSLGIPIGLVVLGFSWVTAIPAMAAIIYFVPRWVEKYRILREGLTEVKNGNFDKNIVLRSKRIGEFERIADDINSISRAQAMAVEKEIRNQRLKSELISNVSHDLRTPLTSMVSYVDLLRKEGFDSENADEYLDIIQNKTKRLQKLTEDLFEAAKASSGDMPTDIKAVQVQSIVEQALVETADRIKERQVEVICNYKTENPSVMADGKLLWRVMENLLSNISKYALEHSRAYIDVTEDDDTMRIEIKNISKEPLNISEEELMERFKRGDESRNTEGSGLGLAIARDLMTLMGGNFKIVIDGDLFKVILNLKKGN